LSACGRLRHPGLKNEGLGSPACGRLRHPLSRFYEFKIAMEGIEVHLDGAAQGAGDAPATRRELQAVGVRSQWGDAPAEVGAAPGQHPGGVDHGAPRAPLVGVTGDGEAHQLGLRRDASATHAAAPGHVARYGACPPALS
jgi:hypothetical protein